MGNLFHVIFYQPLYNALVWFYNIVPGQDLGVSIIILTIAIRAVLWPVSKSAIEAQKSMQDLQPKLEAVKKQHKDDKQKQTQAIMDLYKEEKINPLGSCLPLLIQLPIFIALYWVLRDVIDSNKMEVLYSFVQNPGQVNPLAFGFLDLGGRNIFIALAAGAAQYWQASQLITKKPEVNSDGSKDESMAAAMNKQMRYTMPLITVVIGATLPAGLAFYWFLTTLVYAIQQHILFRKKPVEVLPAK